MKRSHMGALPRARFRASRNTRNSPAPVMTRKPEAMMPCSTPAGSFLPRTASAMSSARYPPSKACTKQGSQLRYDLSKYRHRKGAPQDFETSILQYIHSAMTWLALW